MHLFYAPEMKNNIHPLSEEESRHIVKVLRLQKGDHLHLTDGRGGLYRARLIDDHIRRCRVEVEAHEKEYGKRPYYLHIAIAPTKNIKRFEWFLEKATEIGVDEITPLHCFHSERRRLKTDRMERILIAAMKQSLKTYLPKINEMTPFDDLTGHSGHPQQFIACLEEGAAQPLKDLCRPGEDALVVIGPEGDFSTRETEYAKEKAFQPVTLGKSRLRTETAGIVSCHTINMLNGY
jgi:16S rRNA (uracil1498-N3)-methyltransferase